MSATSCLRYFMEDLFFGCSGFCAVLSSFQKPCAVTKEHKIFTVRAVVVSVITILCGGYFAEIYVISNNFFINIYALMQKQKLFGFGMRFKCCQTFIPSVVIAIMNPCSRIRIRDAVEDISEMKK